MCSALRVRPSLRSRQVLFALVILSGPSALPAVICSVPSTVYPTLGAAIRDGACVAIQLAAGVYPENVEVGRSLSLSGAGSSSTVVAGSWTLSGASTMVSLDGLHLDGTAAGVAGCWPSLLATSGGASLASGNDLVVSNSAGGGSACRLFSDDFESGGVLAWSAHQP